MKICIYNPRETGFTLLEILITVIVFSIGLLGLATLQVNSLRLVQSSFSRTIATLLAEEMADRMRANKIEVMRGQASAYNNPGQQATGHPHCLGKNGQGSLIETGCTPTEMAEQDFYEWYRTIQGRNATSWHAAEVPHLPSGNAVVCIDSTPDDGTPSDPQCDNILLNPDVPVFTVKIWWIERLLVQNQNFSLNRYVTTVAI